MLGAYAISKAADHHLVRNLAAEWGPKNVRVNAIAPGLIKTDFAKALWEDDKRRTEREAQTPCGAWASRATSAASRCSSPPRRRRSSPARSSSPTAA